METILQDDAALLHRPDAEVTASMRRLAGLGVDRVRLTAGWSVIAPGADSAERPQFDATDPDAYPRGAWRNLDRAVRLANEAGLEVMIDLAFWAPLGATSGDPNQGRARWNVDPSEFARFAAAAAKRYSGAFRSKPEDALSPQPAPSRDADMLSGLFSTGAPARTSGPLDLLAGDPEPDPEPSAQPKPVRAQSPLPAVRWWTIWNEPNHPGFLQPQWERRGTALSPRSPHLYRALVEAAYPAIKGVQPDSKVLVGGTSSTGAKRPASTQAGVPPLLFLRELACVDRRFRPLHSEACRGYAPLHGDGFAHHPYSLLHKPGYDDRKNTDNVPIGSLPRLTATLDRLVRMRRVDRRLADVYLTEFGYETNPPDRIKPFGPVEQALFINWAEYLAVRNPRVRSWPQFLLQDMGVVSPAAAAAGRRDFGDWQSGLLFADGTPKPSLTSFKLALFACIEPKRKNSGEVREQQRRWGHRPATVMIWGHVRPGRGPRQVVLLRSSRSAGFGPLASSPGRSGRATRVSSGPVTTDPNGFFTRYAPYEPGARYRLEHRPPSGAPEQSPPLRPERCSRGQTSGVNSGAPRSRD